jgi:hypothetical protein
MNFKNWLVLTEAIDELTKGSLEKFKADPIELAKFIKELQDDPKQIDRKTAFDLIQKKFNIQKKEKPKDEDAQLKHFQSIPNTTKEEIETYKFYKDQDKNLLKEMMELLREFLSKNMIQLKIENNKPTLYRDDQKIDTPDFTRFLSTLHGLQSELKQYSSSGKPNPLELEFSHSPYLVKKGDNVWVFKGNKPDICRTLGKNQSWCISSSKSAAHWFNYRIDHGQTQYFVFDFNKSEDDPARFVNPGVAPEGGYSEWVDAMNQHSTDPEDPESHVGINGYRSINQYKKYLASKGIPESIWQTTDPEDWEKRLAGYQTYYNFAGAKNDPHPEVFPLYLKIAKRMDDKYFDTLNEYEKEDFLLGKAEYLTEKQFDYAIKNLKGYYNSLNFYDKVIAAAKTNDHDHIVKLIQDPNFTDDNFYDLLKYATDKDEVAKTIIENKEDLTDKNVDTLLGNATNTDEIAELIINKKDLTGINVFPLLDYAKNPDKIAKLIINKKKYLTGRNVFHLLRCATNKNEIAKLLGPENINKLNASDLEKLLIVATKPDEMAKLIIQYKTDLTDINVGDLLNFSTNKDEIAELIIQKKTDLTGNNVYNLLRNAKNLDKIAELLGQENISKLSNGDVNALLYYASDKDEMRRILKKYGRKIRAYPINKS